MFEVPQAKVLGPLGSIRTAAGGEFSETNKIISVDEFIIIKIIPALE